MATAGWPEVTLSRRLKCEELRAACDPAALPFRSTRELTPLDRLIGQERALEATTFGLGMIRSGYNMFVLGLPATGKTSSMLRLLEATAAEGARPSDDDFGELFRVKVDFDDSFDRTRDNELPAT